jgi:hypothetical protein
MSKWHRVRAEMWRMERLGLNLAHTETRTDKNAYFVFDDEYTAALLVRFLHMALYDKRPRVLIHNGRKPR